MVWSEWEHAGYSNQIEQVQIYFIRDIKLLSEMSGLKGVVEGKEGQEEKWNTDFGVARATSSTNAAGVTPSMRKMPLW
jgi:hypothetical protein